MDPARWEQIKAIVHDGLELPIADRDGWLSRACGDDALLLGEARTLIRAVGVTQQTSAASEGSSALEAFPLPVNKVGRSVGHYELVERIGAGGMGEVYRARDLALGREAALKLLPPLFDPDLRVRLIHEAEASAKLQHPAIATFYEAGEEDGETFIAMEFVRGQTLRNRLREGAIPTEGALAITFSLLEALAHAHAAGLLHRDIKPENIVVSGPDSVKLLDFGIAAPLATSDAPITLRPTATHASVTADGGLVGTLGYLAPEQLAGDPLDARTDVFQVGVVLYEMLTGTPAFGGSSVLDRLIALMKSEPDLTPIPASGAALISALRRAMARAPSDRYQTARAFLTELRELAARRTPTAVPKVVAVLDLDNRTGDSDLNWLGSALAESLRASLAKLPQVAVIPRQKLYAELLALKQQSGVADPIATSLRLGSGWAITGHLERSADLIDVHVRVVDVPTGAVVATRTIGGPAHDLFALENGLTTAIQSITGEVIRDEPRRDGVVEAHECYLRAELLINRISKGSLEDARVLLERAVTLDERHADALAALAQTYALRSIATTSASDLEAALAYAERSLAISPDQVRGLIWKGYVLYRIDRFDEGASTHRRAIELAPNDAEAHYFAASGLLFSGRRRRDTLPLLQRCVELDSGRGMIWLALGTAHLYLEQRKQAIYCFGRAHKLESEPAPYGTAGAAAYRGEVLRLEGRLNDARLDALAGIEAAERSDHVYRDTFRAYALCVLGRVALDQQDQDAAIAAFHQVLAQARGRVRTRACGHFVIQALAGLTCATRDGQYLDESRKMLESRETYNFEAFYGATDDLTFFELALAAKLLGRPLDAEAFFSRARAAGSLRAL